MCAPRSAPPTRTWRRAPRPVRPWSPTPGALRRFMLVKDAASLEDYLARFEYTIPLLQTPEGIERVSYEMVEDAARDGLRYLEVRYCPKLSTRGGLTMAQALEAELRGLARGERD